MVQRLALGLLRPAAVALGVAVFAFVTMRDTPQSCGLPSVETWKQDFPEGYDANHEREFSTREISWSTC